MMNWAAMLTAFLCVAESSDVSRSVNTTEFERCSCDMTGGICDVYCCCDQDCTDHHKKAFPCRDQQDLKSSPWECDSRFPVQNGFHQILCIEKENNPYLGLYHRNVPHLNDIPSINDVLQKKEKYFNDAQDVRHPTVVKNRYMRNSAQSRGYVYGQDLMIVGKNLQTASLYVPYNVYSRACDAVHPVQYLKDISSSCLVNVKESCLSKQFEVNWFLLGTTKRQLLGSASDETPLSKIHVSYFVPNDLCCYVKTTECMINGCKDRSLKNYSSMNRQYPKLQRGICSNSVLEVRYLFHWSGSRVLSANITFIVADVPSTDNAFVTQRFSVAFSHFRNKSFESDMMNISSGDNKISNLGYKRGDPLVGLCKDADDGDSDFVYMNESFVKKHLTSWANDIVVGSTSRIILK